MRNLSAITLEMWKRSARQELNQLSKTLRKASVLTLAASVILIVALAGQVTFQVSAANLSHSLNNVQIFVQSSTNPNNLTSYSLTVYNSSGFAVASSDGSYPAFGVELPAGTYLFTVLAMQSYQYPVAYAATASGVATGSPNGAPQAGTDGKLVYSIRQPAVEYGYLMQQVNGAEVLNIQTSEIYNVSTTRLSVQVSYANGTAASGVSVQSSIVGEWYWYGGGPNTLTMWNQTDSVGRTTLVVPDLPIEVSAWTWVPVDLPQNLTTVQREIGGQLVNVTVYWQPTDVGLASTSLVMPPSTSTSITLHVQQPNYWVIPYGVRSAGVPYASGAGVVTSQGAPSGAQQYATPIPTNQYSGGSQQQPQEIPAPTQIPPLGDTSTTTVQSSDPLILTLSIAVVLAVALGATGLVFALRRGR